MNTLGKNSITDFIIQEVGNMQGVFATGTVIYFSWVFCIKRNLHSKNKLSSNERAWKNAKK